MLEFEPGWQDWLNAMEQHPDIRKPLMAEPRLAQQAEGEGLARPLSRTGPERSAVFPATTVMRNWAAGGGHWPRTAARPEGLKG